MSESPAAFTAFVADHDEEHPQLGLRSWSAADLLDGEVTIRVLWSSVNYKDALAASPQGRVARISPIVPGIDLAGEVVESDAAAHPVGALVLAHGYGLGVSHHGGFAGYARIPAEWVVPLPPGLSARDAMAFGTAGFTAALSLERLERAGLRPEAGPVLVTGAGGGVGGVAVMLLAQAGYEVVASTGKDDHERLRRLGAAKVLSRAETSAPGRPLERQTWAGVVDPVGGSTLAYALSTTRYGGAVACSGNTGGVALETTVLPFILRGISLHGIDSVEVPLAQRQAVWDRLAGLAAELPLDELATEIELDQLESALASILQGEVAGRTVLRVGGE